ncbi:hypothetical protein [Halalkalibacter oceani]|uniref:hypothetical protein n=1 Tax=Halalkalibacter oceani TaxID=1653776 RepID=UPI00339141B5
MTEIYLEMLDLLKKEMKDSIDLINIADENPSQQLEHQIELLTAIKKYADHKKASKNTSRPCDLGTTCKDFVTDKEMDFLLNSNNEDFSGFVIKEQHEDAVDETDSETQKYKIERKIRGAFIPEIEAFIPESIVRQLDLKHGDYVFAEPYQKDSRKFNYSLAERGNGENDDRIQWNKCVVQKQGAMFVIEESLELGKIKLGEAPHAAVLSDEDVRQFELADGSVIDVACLKGNEHQVKVIWKHG